MTCSGPAAQQDATSLLTPSQEHLHTVKFCTVVSESWRDPSQINTQISVGPLSDVAELRREQPATYTFFSTCTAEHVFPIKGNTFPMQKGGINIFGCDVQ